MKKSKRILSLLTALTITASAFASLAIPAGAADDGSTIVPAITYEGTDAKVDWTTGSNGRFTPWLHTVGDNTFLTVNQAQRHDNSCTLTSSAIASEFTATRYAVEFDLKLGSSAGQDSTQFRVNTDDGYLISLDQADRSGGFKINDEKSITFPGGGNSWLKTTPEEGIDLISWLHFTVCYGEGPTYVTVTNPALTGDSATVLAQTLLKSGTETGALTNMTFVSSRYDANFAIDNFTVRNLKENEIPTVKYYNVNINTQRYAKIVYKIGEEEAVTTAADVNGAFSLKNIPENTNFEYTISKEGYVFEGDEATKTASAPMTETLNINAPMTLNADIGVSAADLIYHENTFGYATDKLDIAASNRLCDTALGTIEPEDDIYEIMFDLNIPSAEASQVTIAFFGTTPGNNTDGNDIFGLQGTSDGLFAFSDLNPQSTSTITNGWNQNCAGLYDNGVKLADEYTGTYKVDMIVNNKNHKVSVKAGDNASKVVAFTQDASKLTYLRVGKGGTSTGVAIDNLIVKKPDQNYVGVTGDDKFAKIKGKTVTRTYEAEALVPLDDESFTWTVTKADGTAAGTGVSIDSSTGVLSVTDEATAGDYKVKAASTVESTVSATKVGEYDVTIADYQQFTIEIEGPQAYNTTETGATYSIVSIKDALGDDVMEDVKADVKWTSSTPATATIVEGTGVLTVVAKGTTTVKAALTNDTLEASAEIPVKVDTFYKTAEVTSGETTMNITTDDMVSDNSIIGYRVTTSNDNVLVNQTDVLNTKTVTKTSKAGYKIVATYDGNKLVSIAAPVEVAANVDITTPAANTKEFYWDGMTTIEPILTDVEVPADNSTITVDTTGADKVEVAPIFKYTETGDVYATPYIASIPDGSYSFDFEKVTTGRCDLKVNGYIVIEEAGMGGTGRGVSSTRTYSTEHVVVNKGKAVIGASGTCNLASVKVVKEPGIVTRKTHIWIGGDSTVCRYDGNEETGDVKDLQTGWGQVIGTYLDDTVVISDLAESGSYIHRWIGEEYPTVRDMIQPGDYFIIQMGINDRSHTDVTNETDMKTLLGQMVDEVRDKGGIPVLVTPQKSKGYAWYSADSEKGDITTWNGAGISWSSYGFGTGVMKSVAEEKNTLFIDNASMSAEAFFNLGADYVIANFHLSNEHSTGKEMHWSYAGAQKIASMIAQSIYDQKKANTTTTTGESFAGIPVNTTGSFTFVDTNEETQTYKVVDSASQSTGD